MEKQSWVCTFITQISLCIALFLAFNMCKPQKPKYHNKNENNPVNIYFISVSGGYRSLQDQTHLLKLMEKVINTYKARFVVNISELGDDDPLMLNATWYFQKLKVPWYTTRALKGQGAVYFLKKLETPFGKTLDIIAVDTGSLKDDSSGTENNQLHWLTRTLEASDSNWQIVVGFHPLVACEDDQIEVKQVLEPLHNILLKYGVNAYLSGEACGGPLDKGPHFTSINQRSVLNKEKLNGFLLHRVSPLEIVTYLVSLTGEVVQKIGLQQRGKDVM